MALSRLAWGVWIEIKQPQVPKSAQSVTPRMRRVDWNITNFVKNISNDKVTPRMRRVDWNLFTKMNVEIVPGHASHEACGLKSLWFHRHFHFHWSRLAWGVWIEIISSNVFPLLVTSRLAWGVWIEITLKDNIAMFARSRLAWGVWIEINVSPSNM